MILVGLALAAPAPAAFEFVKEAAGCQIAKRDKTEQERAAMRAVCEWPELPPATLLAMLSKLDDYERFVWPILESEVRRSEPDRQLVYQRQHLWGMADREVLLWVRVDTDGQGGTIRWETASDEPFVGCEGCVRSPHNVGSWAISARPDGGSRATHTIEVDAGGGGPLPGWLLRMIQVRGFARVLDEVREAAQAAPQAPAR